MLPSCVVLQPDGRYALFAREHQDFTHLSLSLPELLALCDSFRFDPHWVQAQIHHPTAWNKAVRAGNRRKSR